MKVELFKSEIMLIGFPSKIIEAIIKGKKAKNLFLPINLLHLHWEFAEETILC